MENLTRTVEKNCQLRSQPSGSQTWRSSRRSLWVLLLAAALVSSSSAALLYRAFVTHLDAQSGIVFLSLPFWQLIGFVPFLLLALLLRSQPDSEVYELDWPEGPPSEP